MSGLLAFTKIAFSAPRIALTNSVAARGYATKKLFIGNIAWGTTDDEAKEFFSQYGQLTDAYFPKDPQGRTKGYGFIELDEAEADKVIQEANGRDFNGRELRVDPANKREDRPRDEFRPRGEFRPRREFNNNREDGGDRQFRPRREGGDRQFRPRREGGDRQFRPRGDAADRE
ncbi:hypothetical protein BGX29_011558 [Mortierella sp. GBA35]|nr:hypothetical protein BGX23_012719 [Mortierella sp. AD031]KAF9090290.1 hypothetical protein BGX29_011558 [Mortierella sp. GBA35]KAG0199035.1 hypothetical protein BGX33_011931 [Mortierella sp. NVP41]